MFVLPVLGEARLICSRSVPRATREFFDLSRLHVNHADGNSQTAKEISSVPTRI